MKTQLLAGVIGLLCFTNYTYAQSKSSVEIRLRNLIEYSGLEVQDSTFNQWVDWVQVGESLNEEVPARNQAWLNFLIAFYRQLGTIPNATINEQSLQAWSQYLTFPFLTGRILDFRKIGREQIDTNEIISKSGTGKQHLLVIPPFGFNSDVFEVLKSKYEKDFTFHEVAFPAGADSWKYPEKAAFKEAMWLNKVESSIAAYLDGLGNQDLTVVSLGTGTYFAIRLAQRFSNIRGIVSINGRYRSELIDPQTGNNAEMDYRDQVSVNAFPTSMMIQFSPGVLARNYGLTKDAEKNQVYLNQITPENVNVLLRYNQEFAAQDISSAIRELDIPILSLVSEHNDQSVQASDRSVFQLWEELKLDMPEIPISLVRFPDSQNLIFIDQPDLFAAYFEKFLDNPAEPVVELGIKPTLTVALPSPEASVSQVVESTRISIEYSQPAVNGRKIYGELVPYDRIWRAGANAATKLTVTNDVLINEDQFLAAGTYSLFFVPGVEKWEVVLNAIPDQWGSFNYKSDYDALRFRITPEKCEQQEFLTYDIDRYSQDVARISMAWDEVAVSFNISQFFELPHPPHDLESQPWIELLTDHSGDGVDSSLTDGKALSYLLKNDTLWFRFDLHRYENKKAFALNVLIDADNDQKTGAAWFGQNTAFTFEKALTVWMQKSGKGFQGLNGIMSPEDFSTGNQNLVYQNNIRFYLDFDRKRYYAGVKVSDLELPGKKIRVIGAVGEFQTWNDDIGDQRSALIDLNE